tara:strand:+ start:3959 stop:4213 length:255 start_codon:yes stop_codon:yes gene_type:complete
MTEIDRLIAMLEPSAEENTVLFVREQLGKLLHGAYTNDYVPRAKLDDEVFPEAIDAEINIENDWSCTGQGEQLKDWNPNDPANW